jgi:antirestriction protein ArdC
LIAEMGAAFLCAEAGISPVVLENQAAYVQGWLRKIRGDKRLVVIAAAQAQKAADYILNAAVKRPEA